MKKILTMLSIFGVTATISTNVVSCTKPTGVDISTIARPLKMYLIQEEEPGPWTKEELEKKIVDKKVDIEGGITVEVGKPEPGVITKWKQSILFKGNATKDNNFIYSGTTSMDHVYGENAALTPKPVSQNDINDAKVMLDQNLSNRIFDNEDQVKQTIKTNGNIPGGGGEALKFGTISNMEFDKNPISGEPNTFSFSATFALSNDEIFKFAEEVKPNQLYSFTGKVKIIKTNLDQEATRKDLVVDEDEDEKIIQAFVNANKDDGPLKGIQVLDLQQTTSRVDKPNEITTPEKPKKLEPLVMPDPIKKIITAKPYSQKFKGKVEVSIVVKKQ
ncbi:lipoprotein [Williamsoniiplasma luminosum]|uniref:Lipoprotein n=1 Tax=Williamsoniiplasma luminosum TaxID=214888 RepID=A0A2S0NJL7_9MOLU|nr:lipoprotein [Williamsoniiplasma luminosum]AVP49201.1 MAG: hypothetical protein C5T88_01215 [Williamsoniiplasma luminosum]